MLNLLHLYLDGAVAFAAVTTMMAWLRSGRVLARFTAPAPFWPVVVGLWASDTFSNRRRDRKPIGPTPEPNPFLLAAQREVDAMLPGTPPIAPPLPTAWQLEQARGAQNACPQQALAANYAMAQQLNAMAAQGQQAMGQTQLNAGWAEQGQALGQAQLLAAQHAQQAQLAALQTQQGTRRTN